MSSRMKRLPESLHSTMRSGTILFDLTRVVEELVFNSLDAGATKVSVAINVGTFYIKVVDNGSGITRDGLVLLGERYATSKSDKLADMEASNLSFGFRGEALGSISDVSLLEIVSKAHGRPNGYHKIIKGCKCLYLGIDDDRQDVGTTVIVRDLFYNQPVRRKHMQSSPKKVLHLIKECLLRIALVYFTVSFKVLDIESEDELLCTYPSSSPLPLLRSGFGIEFSSYLHELNTSDSILKLSGYVSNHSENFSVKVFQYFYINSRFISRGPIHKLLNQLASRFSCSDLLKANMESQNGKRSRSQTYPTYILNLSCPISCYDLTFEPSKTSVEFKDWKLILTFIEKAVTNFWSSYGSSLSHVADSSLKDDLWAEGGNIASTEEDSDFQTKDKVAKKRCRSQNHQASLGPPSAQPKLLTEEYDPISAWRYSGFPCQNSHRNKFESKECITKVESVYQTDYSYDLCDASFNQDRQMINQESGKDLWTPNSKNLCAEDDLLDNKFFDTGRSNKQKDDTLGSRWEDVSLKVNANMSSGLIGSTLSECFEIGGVVQGVDKALKKPFLQNCSSHKRRLLLDGASFASDEGFDFQIGGFTNQPKQLDHDDRVDIGGAYDSNPCLEPRTLWQHNTTAVCSSPRITTQRDRSTSSDFLPRDSIRSPSVAQECFVDVNGIPPDPVAHIQKIGASRGSFFSERYFLTSDPLFGTNLRDIEQFIDEDVFEERRFAYEESSGYDYLADRSEDCILSFHTPGNSLGQENCSSSSGKKGTSDFKSYAGTNRDICDFLGHHLDDFFFTRCSDSFTDQVEWLCLDTCGKDNTNNCGVPLHKIPSSTYVEENNSQKLHSRYQNKIYCCERRQIRSHSAPPFYRGKKKFIALNNRSTMETGKSNFQIINNARNLRGIIELNHPQQPSGASTISSKPSVVHDPLFHTRKNTNRTPDVIEIQNNEVQDNQCFRTCDMDSVQGFTSKEDQDPIDYGLKWRNSYIQTAHRDVSHNLLNRDTILDISSGILHLVGDSLVPKSINKKCLEDAKVLHQVDKKFIPVVAGRTLAIIDQHAADERIRLEELRHKVLSGEMKTITYLDAEQELVLPEIGHQLLHNYAKQIQNWGWICNFHVQDSRSFKRNLSLLHKRPTVATLLGVPCILGVSLTDVDLLEFLQQLADTDGSSTIPPSVLRILNNKACRGAIMFGDTLLPSECSLIVEELKKTSLCFQCAHGRPTTVPLVNLEALHKQIAELGLCSNESWHGLHRHEISLQRAAQRLSSTGGQC